MKTVALVQARMGSTRFPDKVMRRIAGVPMIELQLERLARAKRVDQVVLATTVDPRDDALADYVRSLGYSVYRGSEGDVLDRFFQAATEHDASTIVRITGDCPLTDPELVDAVIDTFTESGADYASNNSPPSFPDGLDVEVMSYAALERAWREAGRPFEREHVTPYLIDSAGFQRASVTHPDDLSALRWTVDEPDDFTVIDTIFRHFQPRRDFSWQDVLAFSRETPAAFDANRHIGRNEGATLNTGQKLWKRARRVIPGGSMLLSKRPEMFLPDQWPAYFSRASGCRVTDLDGREYVDMSLMGIGTNILGYGHPEVDDAVRAAIAAGNMSTLNAPEEVYLAERLVELHPWAAMVRFARTGGEADAIAVRIARAAAGREQVAFCGYHGWHDWYLATNLGSENSLAGHLLPGLEPNGVPSSLSGTVHPFTYNRFDELERLVANHDIGVVMMEVVRSEQPAPGFLEKVRELTTRNGIVLIFDECTSGFRQTFGGLHKHYGVEPDMAVFGKALGNGYPVTAIIGRRDVMEAAQSTFISSTFWTDRIGSAAALKTLDVMERVRSWKVITEIGTGLSKSWAELGHKHSVPLRLSGLPALASFAVDLNEPLVYKTLITQEMLRRGFLASTAVYACVEHTPAIIASYLDALDEVFAIIARNPDASAARALLEGPVCQAGFRRLN